MNDKVIVITGASDGIGAVAAKKLHELGATVVVIGRSPEKTKQVAESIDSTYYTADFARLDDVRSLAAKLRQDFPKIDVLINNAGGIFGNRELTIDGHEKTLQVNHLAPFLLTTLLIDILTSSKATIINTSSIANERFGNLDVNDIELEKGFTANRAYGNAKLANILFTRELHRRFNAQGITAAAVHPGIVGTNFANDTKSIMRFLYQTPLFKPFLDTPQQGAGPLVWLATTKSGTDWQSGQYYNKKKIGSVNKRSSDERTAELLWDYSIKAIRR
jgi:NAD(P)-dependent dehydrogenase (short-subunit alcohol dehydrogenase family)